MLRALFPSKAALFVRFSALSTRGRRTSRAVAALQSGRGTADRLPDLSEDLQKLGGGHPYSPPAHARSSCVP